MRAFLLILLTSLTAQLNLPSNLVPISKDLAVNTEVANKTLTVWIKKTGPGYASWGFGTLERADVFLIEFPDGVVTFKNCLITGLSPPSCFKAGAWALSELVQYSNNNWAAKIEREIINVFGVQVDPESNNVVFSSGNSSTTFYGFEGSRDTYQFAYWNIRGEIKTSASAVLRRVFLSAVFFLVLI